MSTKNKKITSRMKKIINWDFIKKVDLEAEEKLKDWQNEILEKKLNEKNYLEALEKNNVVDFENAIKYKKQEENIFKEEEKNIENQKNLENLTQKNINFLNIKKDFFEEKEEENLEKIDLEKIDLEKNKNIKEEKDKKAEKIEEKQENLDYKNLSNIIFDEKTKIEQKNNETKKQNYIWKIFFYLTFFIILWLSWYFWYENKEKIINFIKKEIIWEDLENQKNEEKNENLEKKNIEKKEKSMKKIENENIKILWKEYEVEIFLNEKNEKFYGFEGKKFKGFLKLKEFLLEKSKNEEEKKIREEVKKEFL